MKRRLVRRPLALLISSLAFLLILTVVLWPRLNLPAQASQQPTPTMTPVAALETGLTPALVQSSLQSDLPAPVPTEAAPSIPILTPTSGTIQLPTITPQYMQSLISGEYVSDRIPADGEKSIVINISEQRLYAYQGGTLVFQFIVSTGANNGTRTGTFSILDKLPKAYDADWNFWMPDWMGIYYAGTYEDGIHTLPILTDGQRIWGDSLGTPVTYGCVVLGISESHLLYDWAEVGTPVQINP